MPFDRRVDRKAMSPSSVSIYVLNFLVENRGMIKVVETSDEGGLLVEFLSHFNDYGFS